MILKKEIIEQLSQKLSLPFKGIEQDWDLEMANFKRIDEFLNFYIENKLSIDEKIALMSLILASYEDYLNENDFESNEKWNEIKKNLKLERIIFVDLIDYWALGDEKGDNFFKITPLIRNIDSQS